VISVGKESAIVFLNNWMISSLSKRMSSTTSAKETVHNGAGVSLARLGGGRASAICGASVGGTLSFSISFEESSLLLLLLLMLLSLVWTVIGGRTWAPYATAAHGGGGEGPNG